VFTDEDYLDVMGITLLHGTNIHADEPGPFLGNESYALGTYGRSDASGEVTPSGLVVRGVVKDVAFEHPAEPIPQMGINASSLPFFPLLLVKTAASPAELRRLLQERIDTGELEIGIADIERLASVANRDLLPDRARMAMTAVSALLVVVLSAFGFYGTQRYLVTAGQREYAIRSAVGAGPSALGRLVLARGLSLGTPGLAVGSLLAFEPCNGPRLGENGKKGGFLHAGVLFRVSGNFPGVLRTSRPVKDRNLTGEKPTRAQ
jgi:hypothetical protein